MLNMALSLPDLTVRAKSALSEERSLIPSLMQLLDHSVLVLRAKGIIAVLLLARCVPAAWPWLATTM
jgi:serine/threonine-protein kinase ULK4